MRIGQASVLVLLVLAVGLTTGLAVVSRSVTDIATTTTQEESSQSLSAAEAGVENALSNPQSTPTTITVGNVPVSITPRDVAGSEVESAEALVAGESATFKLEGYNDDTLYLCWQNPDNKKPAIEATFYARDGSIKRWVFRDGGGFSSPDGNAGNNCPSGHSYSYAAKITPFSPVAAADRIMLRARLLYNGDSGSFVGVKSNAAAQFPTQGKNIDSSAQSGDTTRKINVESRDPDMSPLLDTAVFSGQNLEKN